MANCQASDCFRGWPAFPESQFSLARFVWCELCTALFRVQERRRLDEGGKVKVILIMILELMGVGMAFLRRSKQSHCVSPIVLRRSSGFADPFKVKSARDGSNTCWSTYEGFNILICNCKVLQSSAISSLLVMGFGVWGLGFGVWGLGFGVWTLGSRVLLEGLQSEKTQKYTVC